MTIKIPAKIMGYFPDQKESVIKNALIVAQGIFKAKSVNLQEVKDELPDIIGKKTTAPESNYKRLTRFFLLPDEEKQKLFKQMLTASINLINEKQSKLSTAFLTIDGTKWQGPEGFIHLLSLCIVVNGVSIPLWWIDLAKKGHSSQVERMDFFKKALELYDLTGKCLLGDREYIGREFLTFLTEKELKLTIRLPKGVYKEEVDEAVFRSTDLQGREQHLRYSAMERKARLPKYANTGVSKRIKIKGKPYLFIMVRNNNWEVGDDPKEELLYLISSLDKKKKAIKAYRIRWSIECCFKHLKSKGFDLEAINLRGDLKIMLMVSLVTFMYTLCVVQGLFQLRIPKKSDWRKYKDGKVFLAKSYFRTGKAFLRTIFCTLSDFVTFLNGFLNPKNVLNIVFVQ